MTKRPTPKKRRAKSKGNAQEQAYIRKQTVRLKNKQNSPFAVVAEPKNKGLKSITKIKA